MTRADTFISYCNILYVVSADLILFETFLEENELISQYKNILSRPDTFTANDMLVSLDLSDFGLEYLPDGITHFSNLERLILRNNYISELPDTIDEMSNLLYLDLTNNPIEYLPPMHQGIEIIGLNEEIVPERYSSPVISPQYTTKQIEYHNPFSIANTEHIRRIIIERRCCQLSGRLGDRYCQMCGRVIPEDYMVNKL